MKTFHKMRLTIDRKRMMLCLHTLLVVMLILECTSLSAGMHQVRKAKRLSRVIRKIGIKFSCEGRPTGYYADMDFDCRIFHVCDPFGRRVPMRCPKYTKFNQQFRVCDWADHVQCDQSDKWFDLNKADFGNQIDDGKDVEQN